MDGNIFAPFTVDITEANNGKRSAISLAENIRQEPTNSANSGAKRRSLRALRRGDEIEARRGARVYYRGQVADTAPGLGTVWIRQAADGTRRALNQDDFTFWKTVAR